MALPMVPAADFKQSLHLKAAVWQETQGILKSLQPCDGYIFTLKQKHQDRSVCLFVYLFAVVEFCLLLW